MYCSNCGKPDQTPDAYCRSCGEFLTSSAGSRIAFGGHTPQQNLTAINVLSLIAAIVSLHVGIWMYLTNFNFPIVLYLAAAVLICNAGWHFSNFIIGTRLKRRLNRAKEEVAETIEQMQPAETRPLLPDANTEDVVPLSVTERTTRDLATKIKR